MSDEPRAPPNLAVPRVFLIPPHYCFDAQVIVAAKILCCKGSYTEYVFKLMLLAYMIDYTMLEFNVAFLDRFSTLLCTISSRVFLIR